MMEIHGYTGNESNSHGNYSNFPRFSSESHFVLKQWFDQMKISPWIISLLQQQQQLPCSHQTVNIFKKLSAHIASRIRYCPARCSPPIRLSGSKCWTAWPLLRQHNQTILKINTKKEINRLISYSIRWLKWFGRRRSNCCRKIDRWNWPALSDLPPRRWRCSRCWRTDWMPSRLQLRPEEMHSSNRPSNSTPTASFAEQRVRSWWHTDCSKWTTRPFWKRYI